MLRRHRSLMVRAALIFVPIYVATFLAGLLLLSAMSLSVSSEGHHSGPNIALALAAEELEGGAGALRLPNEGSFARLAGKNPGLWLLVRAEGRRLSFGPVPRAANDLFDRAAGALVAGQFHVPGARRPLSDAAMERRGDLLLAAGGVDPQTISFAQSLRFFMGEGLFVILVGLGALGLLAMLASLPLLTSALNRLAADAAAIRPERPDRRIPERGAPTELLPLVRGFNAALDRLSSELARRKRFIADIAHELRTPLTIISLRLDSLEDGEAKQELQRVVARLSHMVAQMLDLERLAMAGRQPAEVDLSALAADVIADIAPLAMAAGYELSLTAPPESVLVHGDAHALSRAIGNLIGNAIAHAGGQGHIQVVVGGGRTLDVIDEGPGVAASIRPILFEPFTRERWDRDGCGLGLHLTREIMRAHGGDAVLLESERGSAFRLDFD